MVYRINGKPVTREKFMVGAKGFNAGDKFVSHIDFKSFVSPVDGQRIGCNKELSEHNARNGVQQVGHEYERKLKKRIEND